MQGAIPPQTPSTSATGNRPGGGRPQGSGPQGRSPLGQGPRGRSGGRVKPKRYPRSFWWYLKWFFITLQLVVFCAIVVTVTAGYGIYQQLSKIMPDVNFITSRNKAEATRIYAADNTLLAEIKGEQRRFVPIEELKVTRQWGNQKVRLPGRLMDATLSIEDKRFYFHPGMDMKRIAGAALANLRSRDSTSQGGSTITEQLAVNIYLTRKKTVSRRLQTALLALQLERRFSKDEILELYLNEIYYGNRAYGCEAAAQTYFDKSAKDLSIAEAALLAGLPNSPSNFDPFDHFDRAKKRQRIVLKEMFENEKINWTQLQEALKDNSLEGEIRKAKREFLSQRRHTQRWVAPYFVSYVKSYLQKQYDWSDEFLNKSGLKIYTTLDPKMQQAAESTMSKRLSMLGQKKLEGAMVCIDPWTGHVLAMVGGRDFYDDNNGGQWNRAVQSKRQSGSSFKPYVYATALEAGYTPDSIVIDSEKNSRFWGKTIRNTNRRHSGAITLRQAIGMSNNVAAVQVLMKVGIQNVVQKAHLMGISSSLVPVPTLALGTSEISVLEHTSAYGVFATGGLRAEETPIERVDNYAGTTLVEHEHPVHGARVLSEEAAKGMWKMLRYVVTSGTGRRAGIDGVDVVGKTGTTSSNKDIWFMGATKQLVCGVWMGFDRPRDIGGDSAGGAWCAPVWRSFMIKALDIWSTRNKVDSLVEDARATDQRQLAAAQSSKIITARICNESGLLANSGCPSTHLIELSSAEGVPTQHCNIPAHGSVSRDSTLRSGDAPTEPQPGDLGYEGGAGEPIRRDGDTARDSDGAPQGEVPYSGGDGAAAEDVKIDDGELSRSSPPADSSGGEEPVRRGSAARGGEDDAPRLLNEDGGAMFQGTSARGGSRSGGGVQVVVTVCADSGLLATPFCPVTAQRFFDTGAAPTHSCRQHKR